MNNVFNVIRHRRSIRKFKHKDIPQKYINKIISAAHLAPSAGNQKNWEFIIIRNNKIKEDLKKAVIDRIDSISLKMNSRHAKNEIISYARYLTFFNEAPVVIAVVAKPYDSLTGRLLKRYEPNVNHVSSAGIQSVAAAIQNFLLAASALRIGSCWMSGPLVAKEKLEEILSIKAPDDLLALIPLGYADKKIKPHTWPKSLDGILREIT